MEQAESNLDSLRVFTTEKWFVQLGMAAGGIACCSSAVKSGCSGGKVMANELTLSVNGAKQVVSATPETPLLFVLRNELKLTGPRLGCGMAQCGACSVLLDGEEVRACITPISYAVGKQVTTIEGLPAVWAAEKSLSAADAAKTLHPIQQAWIDEQVPQRGSCPRGRMMVAVQLLAKNPNPS